jgi:predicted nucleic acid-binding protein
VIYWDTSALVKLYVAEPDSPYFLALAEETEQQIVTSAIATTEVLCALYGMEHRRVLKRGGARRIHEEFLSDSQTGRIVTIPYGPDIAREATKLVELASVQPTGFLVRSLDAIHVASAMISKTAFVVATDGRLRRAAELMGLKLRP